MADFKGYIRLQDGTDELFWNEIDVQGTVEDCNQFLGWNDWTVFQQIFYTNPPFIPVAPPPGGGTPGLDAAIKRDNYFESSRDRVFESYRERVFLS